MDQADLNRRPLVRLGSAMVAPEELASLAEIADMLGVEKRTALRYLGRDDFPEPLGRLATGRVWRRSDVEKWAAKTLPLRVGRPKKRDP